MNTSLLNLYYLVLILSFYQYSIFCINNNNITYTAEECELFAEPTVKISSNMIVADAATNFVVTGFGRMYQPILYFFEDDMTSTNSTYSMYLNNRPFCFSVQSPTLTANEIIHTHSLFGKKIAVNSQYIAVGISNGYERQNSRQYSYSSISVIEYTSNRTAQFREYIEDFSSPFLGVIFDINSRSLASIVSNKEVRVYSPYVNRKNSFWNNNQGDNDTSVALPSNFFAEAVSLSETYLIVSGIEFNPVFGNCSPYVLVYTYFKSNSTFELSFNVRISRGYSEVSSMNFYPCERDPPNQIKLAISPDEKYILISIQLWNTVFLSELETFEFSLRQFISSNLESWGKAVGFTRGNNIFVLTDKNVFIMSLETFIDNSQSAPTSTLMTFDPFQVAWAFPNRIQKRIGKEYFMDTTANDNSVIAVTQIDPVNPSIQYFTIPAAMLGSEYDFETKMWKKCEPGRYKDNLDDFLPCRFCDIGTYQSQMGSTLQCLPCSEVNATYCPVGSSVPLTDEDMHIIYEGTRDDLTSAAQLPKFESADFRDTYEDLLITNLFYISSIPMIVTIVWTIVVWIFVMIAFLFYCHYPTRNCLITIANNVSYIKIPHAFGHDTHQHAHGEKHGSEIDRKTSYLKYFTPSYIKGELQRKLFGIVPNDTFEQSHPSDKHSSHSKEVVPQVQFAASIVEQLPENTKSSFEVIQAHLLKEIIEEEDKYKVVKKKLDFHGILTGYFNFIFMLFSISALIFSIGFLLSYTPTLPGDATKKDKNRFHSERPTLRDSDSFEALEIKAFHALIKSAFTIRTSLIGYSGISCNWSDDIIGFQFEGCWVKDGNFVLPCNQSMSIISSTKVYNHPVLKRTCVYEVNMPNNTILSNFQTTFMLIFKSNLHIQALRYTFYQQAVAPIDAESLFEIGAYQYREVILNSITDDNYMPSTIERTWIWTPVVYKYQYIDSSVNAFKAKAYSTISCEDESTFPTTSFIDYLNDQTGSIKFKININLSSVFLVRQSEKLIQLKAALLNILLAIIGVHHILHFMELIIDKVISVLGILFGVIRRPIKRKIRSMNAIREAKKKKERMRKKLQERLSKHLELETLKTELLLGEVNDI